MTGNEFFDEVYRLSGLDVIGSSVVGKQFVFVKDEDYAFSGIICNQEILRLKTGRLILTLFGNNTVSSAYNTVIPAMLMFDSADVSWEFRRSPERRLGRLFIEGCEIMPLQKEPRRNCYPANTNEAPASSGDCFQTKETEPEFQTC